MVTLDDIPLDILYTNIWPNISKKYKMLLCKDLYNVHHADIFTLTKDYIIYLIKNNIFIGFKLIINRCCIKMTIPKKITYDKILFQDYFNLVTYLIKKYNRIKFNEYVINIFNYKSLLDKKLHKKYNDRNIIWIR